MIGGCIAEASPHGKLVLVDPVGEDLDGLTMYRSCVMVDRRGLPRPSATASGRLPTDADNR